MYERKNPRPAHIDSLYFEWQKKTAVETSKERIWVGAFLDGESEIPVLEKGQKWAYGFPIAEALGILNKLSREGWDVMQVSEDRGLYTGEEECERVIYNHCPFLASQDRVKFVRRKDRDRLGGPPCAQTRELRLA